MDGDTDGNEFFVRSMPVLCVADVLASQAFYVEKLGFISSDIYGDPPGFCIVRRGRVTIALDRMDARPIPTNQYWAAYLYVRDADALAQEFRDAGLEIIRGPEDMPYGLRDFDIRDPDGHLIGFGHDIGDGLGAHGLPPGLA